MAVTDWSRVKAIVDAAIRRRPEERAAYLAEACDGDESVRREVESLLSSFDRADGFMEKPAIGNIDHNETEELTFLPDGQLIGHYQIIRRLGAGGMGVVYLAKDQKLDRHVAIKLLNKRYERNEENVRRFVREAKAASALNHPNILTIHEIGEFEGSQYIVSEYVDGRTLRELVRERKVDLREALDWTTQVAAALSAAHDAKIIHRDIKPENILVRKDGYLKVVDFGLAKLIHERVSTIGLEAKTKTSNETAAGFIVGTVNYMSPEQAKGEKVDGRTDVFSVGVVLYELIAGRTPFAADSMPETFANLIHKEPRPLSSFVDGISNELQKIVAKALSKNPDERHQSMKALLADLAKLEDRVSVKPKLERNSLAGREQDTALLHGPTGEAVRTTLESTNTASAWYRTRLALLLIPALLAGVLVAAWVWRQQADASRPPIRSLAVLPLQNLSGDSSQEFFADGMTESLISSLSQIGALKVISRTSVMRYKDSRESLPDIARALGVDAVIEGSVQRSEGRVRVTAQLIPATTDAPIWSRNYDREIADVLRLQSDVAQAIASEIKVQLTTAERSRITSSKTIDPKAHEAYLLGKFHRRKYGTTDLERAIDYFKRAIEIEPNYADAYAALADAWLDRGIWGRENLSTYESRVREAATTAILIDPDNVNAHVAMCLLLSNYDHDWGRAEEHAKLAVELDPNSVEALVAYSWLLQSLERHDEVRPKMERALQLDPMATRTYSAYGRMLYRAGKYEEAANCQLKAIELDPSNYAAYGRLGDVYVELGRFDDAIAIIEKAASIQNDGVHALRVAYAQARKGDRKKALETFNTTKVRTPWETARLFTALGETDKAFEVLTQAVRARDTLLVHVKADPSFRPLHSDPRWRDILRGLNFPD